MNFVEYKGVWNTGRPQSTESTGGVGGGGGGGNLFFFFFFWGGGGVQFLFPFSVVTLF